MPTCTMDDLTIRPGEQKVEGEITTHTHTIIFARPLINKERHLFTRMIQGFYYTVRFSKQFGDNLVTEPVIEFTQENKARYSLQQRGMSGPWKDLLFSMLANFSYEIAVIREHDGSRIFDPTHRTSPISTAHTEQNRPQPVLAVHEPAPNYEGKQ